ncbi:MFS transporter [Ktedonobacteria bacterium brp13]|nr:MFS transporter [Ktedonobacteria bacterium brp13]
MQETGVSTQKETPERAFAKHLPIYAFFTGTGSGISYTSDVLTLLAIPWFVLQTTGSVEQTGITAFFSTLPTALSAFFGSAIVDRLGYKRTSVIGDVASAVTVALIPFAYHTIGLAFWQLLILVFLGGLLKSPGVTARSSLVPDLAELAKMPLERANAFSDGMYRVSGLIGAPLAGILIAIIGTSNLLWLDAASFFISAALIGLAVPPTPPVLKGEESAEEAKNTLARLWDGLRFLQRDALLLSIVVTVMITNLIDGALMSVVEPAYIKHVFHSALPFGLLVATFGGATFIGTLIFAAIGHRLPRRLTFGVGFTIAGAVRFWILLVPILPLLFVVHALAGLAGGGLNPLIHTIMQERIPAEMRARVFGTTTAGVLVGIPLGTFVSGYVVTGIGFEYTLLLMGTLYFLTTASLLINPALRKM